MTGKRWLLLMLPVSAFVLEALPYGAVCRFGNPDGEPWRVTYSYFSMIPFGYANFAPLITALLTGVVAVLWLTYCLNNNKTLLRIGTVTSAVAVVLSLCPLLLGAEYYSVVGGAITLVLAIQWFVGASAGKMS